MHHYSIIERAQKFWKFIEEFVIKKYYIILRILFYDV